MIFKLLLIFSFFSDIAIASDRVIHADVIKNENNNIQINNKTGLLYDSNVNSSLSYENRRGINASGNATLNWQDNYLYDTTGAAVTLDWQNKVCYDGSSIASINWDSRQLFNSGGTYVIDWQNSNLNNQNGTTVLNFADTLNGGRNYDLAPDVACCTGVTTLNLNSNIGNSADVINKSLTQLDLSLQFDNANNGFKIGDLTQGNFYLINGQSSHQSSGEMGSLTGMNINLQFGDQANVITGGKANYVLGIFNGFAQYDGHEISGYTGYQTNGNVNGTMPVNAGINLFNVGLNIGPNVGQINYNGFAHNTQFENDMNGHGANAFSNGWQFKNGYIGNYNSGYADFAVFQSGSTIQGYQSAMLNPQFDSGADVVQGLNVLQISPHGGMTPTATSINGISVDMSQLSNINSLSKTSINASGGKIQFNLDFDIPDATPAANANSYNLHPQIQSGSPVNNTFMFGNAFNTLFEAHDDMGDDGIGLKLGYVAHANTGLVAVDAGKTVDAYTSFLQGASVPFGSGTINKFKVYRAAGLLPGGGSLTINEAAAFYVDPTLCIFATVCYGLYVNDSATQNYVPRMAINTADQLAYSDSLLSLGDQNLLTGDVHSGIRNIRSVTDPSGYAVDAGYGSLAVGTFTDDSAVAIAGVHTTTKANVASGKTIGGMVGVFNQMSRADAGDDGAVPLALGYHTSFASGNSATKTTDLYAAYFTGFHSIDSNANQIGTMYDFYAQSSSIGSGAVTNRYGIVIEADSGYTKKNWISGLNLIGGSSYTTPLESLHVLGSTLIDEGHLRFTQVTDPVATVDANAGTGATCAVTQSTDSAFHVILTVGSIPASGSQCAVAFNTAFADAPICTVTPASQDAGINLTQYWSSKTTTDWTLNFAVAGVGSVVYEYDVHCFGSKP